jgi:multicomponent Na+:H+ antiporter subunit D
MLIALGTLAAGCVAFGLLPTEVLDHIVSPAAAVLTEPAAYSHALLTGTAPLRLPHLTFPYFAFSELATSLGTLLAGLGLAWYYVRLPREPRVIAAIRRLHTGSVNDYALYAAGGLLISIVVMVTQ